MKKQKLRVIELFAGVGGFRVGLEKTKEKFFNFVWANQWEPSTKTQHAHEIYEKNFGKDSCSNIDITKVNVDDIPNFDFLCAGFPCQDYSVAKPLKYSNGIEGKKGVLWWEIYKIVNNKKPKYILLENVDRLIISPSKQKGKDFAIILSTLNSLGYDVEWKVVNAADYGFPQKRKRIFIFAHQKEEGLNGLLKDCFKEDLVKNNKTFEILNDPYELTQSFNLNNEKMFENSGSCKDFKVETYHYTADIVKNKKVLKDIVVPLSTVPKEFIVSEEELDSWKVFKLGRRINRVNKKTGKPYVYAEGKMAFPDSLLSPCRTIITGEGGRPPSRFKHIIYQDGVYRRLTPIELERANMFDDNHTKGVSDTKRAFLMGNALVTGVVSKIGNELIKRLSI